MYSEVTDPDLQIVIFPDDPEELFEEIESAGSGNYGAVIKARNRATGDILAVKQILITDAEEMEMIRKEIVIMEKSLHPNVVRYYGTYRSLGKLWIAMEYCEGGSVDLIYKLLHRPLPERLIAYVCRQVLLGLQYLHANKRIHRDVKGSNILLTKNGEVKLADFGVSTELKHSMSRRNTFIGTVLWMSPEAIQETEYNDKVDMWSLGITAIEMAENGPPHNDMHLTRAIFHIPRDDPPTLKHKEQWSPQMSVFIKRLLTKDKNIRPSATVMLTDPFVQPENVGTAEELRAIVHDLIEKRSTMDSGRLRRGDYSSSTSTATFVERHSSIASGSDDGFADVAPAGRDGGAAMGIGGGGAGPGRVGDIQQYFTDGTLLPMPLLSTQDIDFDEVALSARDVLPREAEAHAVFNLLASPEEVEKHKGDAAAAGMRVPATILNTTRVVAVAYHQSKELLAEKKLSKEEEGRVQQRMEKYRMILKSTYRI